MNPYDFPRGSWEPLVSTACMDAWCEDCRLQKCECGCHRAERAAKSDRTTDV